MFIIICLEFFYMSTHKKYSNRSTKPLLNEWDKYINKVHSFLKIKESVLPWNIALHVGWIRLERYVK